MEGAGGGKREASQAQGEWEGSVGDETSQNPKDLRQPSRFFLVLLIKILTFIGFGVENGCR